jgi:hypothetical protein
MTFCPFYAHGFVSFDGDLILVDQAGSNRCAIVLDAHSPCIMQINADAPDWSVCRRNPTVAENLPRPTARS